MLPEFPNLKEIVLPPSLDNSKVEAVEAGIAIMESNPNLDFNLYAKSLFPSPRLQPL